MIELVVVDIAIGEALEGDGMTTDELEDTLEVGGGDALGRVENGGLGVEADADILVLVAVAVTDIDPQGVLIALVSTTVVDEDLDRESCRLGGETGILDEAVGGTMLLEPPERFLALLEANVHGGNALGGAVALREQFPDDVERLLHVLDTFPGDDGGEVRVNKRHVVVNDEFLSLDGAECVHDVSCYGSAKLMLFLENQRIY